MNGSHMTHEEFVKAYNEKRISVKVNRSLAIQLMQTTAPAKRYQYAHIFWTWIWVLSIPAAIICFIWVKWWVALIVLAVGLSLPKAIKEAACQNILEQALEDKEFYNLAIELKALVVSRKEE